MKLVVHDFSGHPGQVQLSRELARRGHDVEHQFCSSYTTGRGATERRDDDPENFSVRALTLGQEFARYSPLARVAQELRYAWMTLRAVFDSHPDLVVFSNVPLAPLFLVTLVLRTRRLPYVFWWQDVYSEAIANVAQAKLRRVGGLVGAVVFRMEEAVANGAAAIVPITESFIGPLRSWGVDTDKVTVIPNWGAIDEMPQRARDNQWARAHGLVDKTVVMYAGTLGLKHDPSVISDLAANMPTDSRLVVVSQGKGRQWLEDNASEDPRLEMLDYQPYEQLPDMLASADVLLVVLEQGASQYSVPSKVLNYLCAGRPVLAVMPEGNAAAAMLRNAEAGLVVSPGNSEEAASALHRLLANPGLREQMGRASRGYAEDVFDIAAVGARFETVVQDAYDRTSRAYSKLNG